MFGLQDGVEFPLIQVELGHPIDGNVQYWFRQDGACTLCLETAEQGFANIPSSELFKMICDEENPIHKYFFEARQNKANGVTSFGEQATWKIKGFLNETYMEFEGYTLDQFKVKFEGKEPIAVGLPPIQETHPLTQKQCTVFYVPVPGPLFKLRLALQEGSQWKLNCLPSQLYAQQGQVTMQDAAARMKAQEQYQQVLLSREKFTELLAGSRVSGVAGSQAGGQALGNRVGQQAAWTAALGTSDAKPLKIAATVPGPAPGPVTAARATLVGPPGYGLRKTMSSSEQKPSALIRPPSLFGPSGFAPSCHSAASLKRAPPPSSPSSHSPVTPAPKHPRTGLVRERLGALGKLPVSQLNFASRTPLASTGLTKSDAEPQAPCSKSCASSNYGGEAQIELTGDKFERAKQRCDPVLALQGFNMVDAIRNLKKLVTAAINARQPRQDCVSVQRYCEEAVEILLVNSLGHTWEVTLKRAQSLTSKDGPLDELPLSNYCDHTARYGLEFSPPLAKSFDEDQFFLLMSLEQEGQKREASLVAPTLWNVRMSSEHFETIGAAVFQKAVVEGIFVKLVKTGKQTLEALVQVAHSVYLKVDSWQNVVQAALQDLVQKCRVLFLLHGRFPMMCKARISDLEKQLKNKATDSLMLALGAAPFHKASLDAAWTLNMTETQHWPAAEALYKKFDKDKLAAEFVDGFVKQYKVWQKAIRRQSMEFLQHHAEKALIAEIEKFDLATDMEETAKTTCKVLIQLMRMCIALWKSPPLITKLQGVADFVAKISSIEMRSSLMAGCVDLVEHEVIHANRVEAFKATLPQQPGVVVIYQEASDIDRCIVALEKLGQAASAGFPSSYFVAANAGAQLHAKIKLEFTDDLTEARDKWTVAHSLVSKMVSLHNLFEQHAAYLALGDSTTVRLTKDPNLIEIKKLVHFYKLAQFQEKQSVLDNVSDQQALESLQQRSLDCIHTHGRQHISEGLPAYALATDKLKPQSRGSSDEKSWDEALPNDCKLDALLATFSNTLDKINAAALIELIKTLHTDRRALNTALPNVQSFLLVCYTPLRSGVGQEQSQA